MAAYSHQGGEGKQCAGRPEQGFHRAPLEKSPGDHPQGGDASDGDTGRQHDLRAAPQEAVEEVPLPIARIGAHEARRGAVEVQLGGQERQGHPAHDIRVQPELLGTELPGEQDLHQETDSDADTRDEDVEYRASREGTLSNLGCERVENAGG